VMGLSETCQYAIAPDGIVRIVPHHSSVGEVAAASRGFLTSLNLNFVLMRNQATG
jgi:hypothetical protein